MMAEDYFGNTAEWSEEADGGQVRGDTGRPLTGHLWCRPGASPALAGPLEDLAGALGGRKPSSSLPLWPPRPLHAAPAAEPQSPHAGCL